MFCIYNILANTYSVFPPQWYWKNCLYDNNNERKKGMVEALSSLFFDLERERVFVVVLLTEMMTLAHGGLLDECGRL